MSRPNPTATPAAAVRNGDRARLEVVDLRVEFPIAGGLFRRTAARTPAVEGVSFAIAPGETLGLVGESGCGKTTVGRAILRLLPATASVSGRVAFEGTDMLAADRGRLRALRRRMQIIFQDPGGSMNPRMRIGAIVGEPLAVHGLVTSRADLRARVGTLLERCGLSREAATRYPHEFSGGQRQRICIARALSLEPALLICDEPTSALDVSIQAQILNLLKDLQRDLGLSYLFISHDMGVVQHMCDRIAVMQAARIVEIGPRERVIGAPEHAYTRTLLAAVAGGDATSRSQAPCSGATC